MTKKLFWSNIPNLSTQTNLVINKHIIPLSYIREEYPENLDVKILDNSYSIADFFTKKRTITEGKTLIIDKHILKHKRYSNLQLEIPLISNPKTLSIFNEFTDSLSFFSIRKKSYISVLKVEKGGFIARSFGLLGFLPTNAYQHLKPNSALSIKNLSSSFSLKLETSLKLKHQLKPNKTKWKFLKKIWPWTGRIKTLEKKVVRKKLLKID